MWTYFLVLVSGVGVIMGWFAILERISKRRGQRYHREVAERRRAQCEADPREWYKKQKAIREVVRVSKVSRPAQDESKK